MKLETLWVECENELPPDGETVATKIDNAKGCRNEQPMYRRGRLWVLPESKMYVYYTPTHWHSIDTIGAGI